MLSPQIVVNVFPKLTVGSNLAIHKDWLDLGVPRIASS